MKVGRNNKSNKKDKKVMEPGDEFSTAQLIQEAVRRFGLDWVEQNVLQGAVGA